MFSIQAPVGTVVQMRGPSLVGKLASTVLAALAIGCGGETLAPIDVAFTVEPAVVDVGPVAVGFVEFAVFTISNTGARPIAGRTEVSGASGMIIESNVRWQVDPGRRKQLRLQVTATAQGRVSAEIKFVADDPDVPPATAQLVGLGVPRVFEVEPPALDFDVVRLGTEQRRTLRVTNRQRRPLVFEITPATGADFRIVGATSRQLGPGGSVSFDVAFMPDQPGARRDGLGIVGECTEPCEAEVILVGTGSPFGLRCPQSFDLGTMNPGGCAQATLNCPSILDETAEVLDWSIASDPGSFTTDAPRPVSVAPGNAFTLPIRFCPSDLGAQTGELSISIREPRSGPSVLTVNLTGRGGGPDIAANPATLRFGGARVGDSIVRWVEIENVGYAPLNVEDTEVQGPFVLESDAPGRLEPAERRTLRLRFVPEFIGSAEGQLRLTSDDPDRRRLTVPLTGTGVPVQPCDARFEPTAMTFGLLGQGEENERRLVLRSVSTTPCRWFAPRIDGSQAFVLDPGTPSNGTVTSSQTATFFVTFAPTRADPIGVNEGRLLIDIPNAPGGSRTLDLIGVSTTRDLRLYPTEINIGPVGIDAQRTRTIRLYNLGARTERLDAIDLAPGTSPDFSLASAVSTPFTLAPGRECRSPGHLSTESSRSRRRPGPICSRE